MSNNSNVNTGWKLFEEHIIDLFGCVLPGFSFLSITFLSVAVPWSICTDDFISKASALLHSQSGSFWWVLFIIFMLLSYALGELLIMGDVKEPDRKSMNYLFRRDIVRKFSEKMDVSRLMSYPRKIYEVLNKMQGKEVYEKKEILKILYAASSSLIKIKESGAANQEEEKKWLLYIVIVSPVLVLSLYCIDVCNFGNTFTNFKGQIQHLVAILVSIVIMAAVVGYIKGIVIRHIHYRRTCEVQNILGVYAKVKQDMTKSID